jgi:hypothetical protein
MTVWEAPRIGKSARYSRCLLSQPAEQQKQLMGAYNQAGDLLGQQQPDQRGAVRRDGLSRPSRDSCSSASAPGNTGPDSAAVARSGEAPPKEQHARQPDMSGSRAPRSRRQGRDEQREEFVGPVEQVARVRLEQ